MHIPSIAGHTFRDSPRGRRCVGMSPRGNGAFCDVPWSLVRTATADDVGKTGIAHSGHLTLAELSEITTEVTRENDKIWSAVMDAASAGSR